MKKIIIGLGFGLLLSITSHAKDVSGDLFSALFVSNPGGTGGYLTVRSQVSNHTYPYAGLYIDSDYVLAGEHNPCTINPANGWCIFSINDTHPKTFLLTRVTSTTHPIHIKLALNANQTPISVRTFQFFPKPLESTEQQGRIAGYLYGWETPPSASGIAAAGYTHVLIAFGLFSTTSPGVIDIQSISGFDLQSYVASLHQYGIKVLLSIGGASTSIPNTTVDFDHAVSLAADPSTFEQTFMNSMASLVTTYGFDGFDFDIESGLNAANSFTDPNAGCSNSTYNSTCDISYLSYIINTYFGQHPQTLLTLAPQIANIAATSGFSATWGNYASLIMQTYASLEWVGFQNYNSGCAYGINLVCYPTDGTTLTSTPDPAVAFATDLLANWPSTTDTGQPTGFQPYTSFLSPPKVLIGYVVNNSSGVSDGSPAVNIPVAKHAIQCLRNHESCDTYTPPVTYPGFGGVFAWSINYDASNNFEFATSMYPCVVQGKCN